MRCPSCAVENSEGMKFCIECAAPLTRHCPHCDCANPPQARFCGQCAASLSGPLAAAASPPRVLQAHTPLSYTPAYLAEKILHSKTALEGERKQVTVLFADLKGSMELLADRDPAEALGDRWRLARTYCSQAQYFRILRRYDLALQAGQRALTIAIDLGDATLQVMAHAALGEAYHGQGDYLQAIDLLREAVKSLDGERLHERIGPDRLLLAVTCHAWLVRCLAEVGAFAEGRAISQQAVRMAEVVEHPFSQRIAYDGAGILSLRQGGLPQAVLWLERGLELRQAMGIKRYPSFPGEFFALGCAYALSGRLTEARLQLEEGTSKEWGQGWSAFVGEVYWLTGRTNMAFWLARAALQASRTCKERGHEGWALRLLGEIYMRQDPPAIQAAKTSYDQALVVAEELRMRPLLAHCHLGRGELLATMGQRELARDDLCTARDLYRSMAMTFWAARAQAALAQSSG
jgi:tetratricopeptide (TPR) repeat protein